MTLNDTSKSILALLEQFTRKSSTLYYQYEIYVSFSIISEGTGKTFVYSLSLHKYIWYSTNTGNCPSIYWGNHQMG